GTSGAWRARDSRDIGTCIWCRAGTATPTSCRWWERPGCCPSRWIAPGRGCDAPCGRWNGSAAEGPVARGGSLAGRWGLAMLSLLVAALALSALYARLRPRASLRTQGPASRVIRVQVLNGSGEGGIGARLASYLRDGGFQVVEVTNADRSDYFGSMVVARREDVSSAQAVARYLGGPPVIRQAWASDEADVTVVLGSDRSRLHLE